MTALLQPTVRAAAAPPQPPRRTPGRIAGLDGLRAVAVAAVLIYHLGLGWLPGGFLGVDIFFVISGFLITTLLLGEIGRSGRIDYGQFYLRRARRLLPALFLMLAGTLVLVAVIARDVAIQTLRDLPGALLYVSNWWAIAQEQSYFELIGRGNMLAHLWSLAVEEQFYLIWPLILGLVAFLAKRRVRLAVLVVAGLGALASTVWMATLAIDAGMPIATDPSRVYFGTDSHAMSVLVGAALAAVWNVRRFRAEVAPGARRVLLGAGVVGLCLTAALLVSVSEYSSWLYRGGFLAAALVFALVLAAATHPASPLGPALDNPAMRWVGQRSYGIYLFHWPIFLVTRPGMDVPDGPLVQVGRLALVFAVAEVSYRYVEMPIRQGTFGTWWRSRRVAVAALAATCVVAALLVTAPRPAEVAASQALGDLEDVDDAAAVPPLIANGPVVPAGRTIAWYGDSVTLWSVEAVREAFPGVQIDAGINRAPVNILSRIQADGPAADVVVLHIGNAGPVPGDQLAATLEGLAQVERIVLINSNATFPYVAQANATIDEVARAFHNVVVLDWMAVSRGRTEWFKDGLHLTEAGKAAYVQAVADALPADG